MDDGDDEIYGLYNMQVNLIPLKTACLTTFKLHECHQLRASASLTEESFAGTGVAEESGQQTQCRVGF